MIPSDILKLIGSYLLPHELAYSFGTVSRFWGDWVKMQTSCTLASLSPRNPLRLRILCRYHHPRVPMFVQFKRPKKKN